jgi:hypothetical protein
MRREHLLCLLRASISRGGILLHNRIRYVWGRLLDIACKRERERMRRVAGQNKERCNVPDKIDAQAPVVSMRGRAAARSATC